MAERVRSEVESVSPIDPVRWRGMVRRRRLRIAAVAVAAIGALSFAGMGVVALIDRFQDGGSPVAGSGDSYQEASEIAEVMNQEGITCDHFVNEGSSGPVWPVPEGESWGGCDVNGSGVAIYVLGDSDAFQVLKDGEAVASDDTPRIYWVYGENWFVATETAELRDEIHAVLGGGITDNTRL